MTDDDEDDFEELFSFGGTAPPTAAPNAPSPSNGTSDLDDIFGAPPSSAPSASGSGGSGGSGTTSSEFDIINDDDDIFGSVTGTPATPAKDAVGGGGDDFDDIFGTPPPLASTAAAALISGGEGSVPMVSGLNEDDARDAAEGGSGEVDDFFGEVDLQNHDSDAPAANKNYLKPIQGNGEDDDALLSREINAMMPMPNRAHLCSDDFHPHDADTRDFLEWLDDDEAAKKTREAVSSSENDKHENIREKNSTGLEQNQNVGDGFNSGESSEDSFGFGSTVGDTTKSHMAALDSTNKGESSVGTASNQTGKNADDDEDDDFDFDQMIAEVDAKSTGPLQQQQQQKMQPQPLTGDAIAAALGLTAVTAAQTNNSTSSKQNIKDMEYDISSILDDNPTPSSHSSGNNASSGVDAAEPPSQPNLSARLEEELSFNQWEEGDDAATGGDDGPAVNETLDDSASSDKVNANEEGTTASTPTRAVFTSLGEAIRSNASTPQDIRTLFTKEKEHARENNLGVSEEDRPHLWTKIICGKVLEDLENGSLADSFRQWHEKEGESSTAANVVADKYPEGGDNDAMIDALLSEANNLDSGDVSFEPRKKDLLSLLKFHDSNNSNPSHKTKKDESFTGDSNIKIDKLIPPVVNAILSTGIPPAAASVVVSNIIPSAMPLLRLSHQERLLAAKSLHAEFYLLACYHLPLLVMHLDRHCPGWYWPRKEMIKIEEEENETNDGDDNRIGINAEGQVGKEISTETEVQEPDPERKNSRELEKNGLVPLSWFVTNFAGECGGANLEHKHLLPLWDHMLTRGDYSSKYFLALAVLDQNSDVLLMSRGRELSKEVEKVFSFKDTSYDEESFVGGAASSDSSASEDDMIAEWLSLAKSLIKCTPSSVIERLRTADDRAVTNAIQVHQAQANEKLKAQLEKEANEHEAALKKAREEREAEKKKAIIRARLTAYYRTHNPEKIDTLDEILKLFDGRIEVLNEKLKKKYGEGFLPDEEILQEHVSKQTRSFLMSVNQSVNMTKKHVANTLAERRKRNAKPVATVKSHTPVALEVSPTEVIPLICSTKGHHEKYHLTSPAPGSEGALKWYLVDCRSQAAAKEQGLFPTAVELSPEKLQDPDALLQLTEMFESLRGAVHICIMGEGFASLPVLYDVKGGEPKLLEDDAARTENVALFFLKKGFPFVSVLKGGFAAAHAFLWRKGPDLGLTPSDVLIGYDPIVSLFAQLEIARQEQEEFKNAPAREKTVRTLQKVIDNSMTRLTLEEQRINDLASDLSRPETRDKMKQSVSEFFSRSHQHISSARKENNISFGRTPPLFMQKRLDSSTKDEDGKKNLVSKEDADLASPISKLTEKLTLKLTASDHSKAVESPDEEEAKKLETAESSNNDATDVSSPADKPENESKSAEPESNKPKSENVFLQLQQRLKATSAGNKESDGIKHLERPLAVSNALSSFALRMRHPHTSMPSSTDVKQSPSDKTTNSHNGTTEIAEVDPKHKPDEASNPVPANAKESTSSAENSEMLDSVKFIDLDDSVTTTTTEEDAIDLQTTVAEEKSEAANIPSAETSSTATAAPATSKLFASFASKISEVKSDRAKHVSQPTAEPKKNPFAGFSLRKVVNQPTPEKISIEEERPSDSSTQSDSKDNTQEPATSPTYEHSPFNQGLPARNPFASLIRPRDAIKPKSEETAGRETSDDVEASSITSKLSFGMKFLGEQSDPFQPKSFGFGRSRFNASKPSATAETKPTESDPFEMSDKEEAILFDLGDDNGECEVIDLMGGDEQNDGINPENFAGDSAFGEEGVKVGELFSALEPQPHGSDPVNDLFGDDPFGDT